jgi:hypothetical protein
LPPEGGTPNFDCDALYFDFAIEVLQSSNLALVAAVLPLRSDMFRICARSD